MGLVGCIESLVVAGSGNEHDYDIFYPESDDVISGMGISASTMKFAHVVSLTCTFVWVAGECGDSACSAMPCGNSGSCEAVPNSPYLYRCHCKQGFTGEHRATFQLGLCYTYMNRVTSRRQELRDLVEREPV